MALALGLHKGGRGGEGGGQAGLVPTVSRPSALLGLRDQARGLAWRRASPYGPLANGDPTPFPKPQLPGALHPQTAAARHPRLPTTRVTHAHEHAHTHTRARTLTHTHPAPPLCTALTPLCTPLCTLLEWIALKSSVASWPVTIRIESAPPGWSSKKGVASYTLPSCTNQADSFVVCFSTCAYVWGCAWAGVCGWCL